MMKLVAARPDKARAMLCDLSRVVAEMDAALALDESPHARRLLDKFGKKAAAAKGAVSLFLDSQEALTP